MNDSDIVKALECCKSVSLCRECPLELKHGCVEELFSHSLDLINRQKAEIERLRAGEYRHIGKTVQNARIEGIEDFAKKVKESRNRLFNTIYSDYHFGTMIETLVKEMIEVEHESV